MKSCLALFATAAIFASGALAQTDKVTYKTVAVPVSRALTEISKQAGVTLTAAPLVAKDIVVISVKDMPLADLKTQIAKACSAKWESVSGQEMLIPDLVQRREEERKEQLAYTAQVAKSLKELVDSLNPPKPDPKEKEEGIDRQQLARFLGGGPQGRAIIKLAQSIGANALATVGKKERVVYSSSPTRMQRALPNSSSQILRQLVVEYNEEFLRRQRERSENPMPEEDRFKKLREMFGMPEDRQVTGTPTKAILIVTRQSMLGGLTLNLRVFNEQGKVVITGNQMIQAGGGMFAGAADFEFGPDGLPIEKPQKAPANEKPIEFSATVKELMGLSNVMTMGTNTTKMSDGLREKLLSPDEFDPLSFTHSEALLATAAQKGKNLVGCLPDGLSSYMEMLMPKADGLTPTAYLESISDNVEIADLNNLILIRPKEAASARNERFDRVSLQQFIRATEAKGSVSLDDLAAYAQKSNNPMEDGGPMMYFMFFAPNAVQSGMGGMVSWDMLRFYGGLSPLQRQNMANGTPLAFNQLNPIQLAALRQMTFGPETALAVEDANAPKLDFEIPSFMRSAMFGQMGNDYRSEPTELMPSGLPTNGYVELKLTQDQVAKPTGNVPSVMGNALLGPDELALFKLFKELPGMEAVGGMMPTIDEVKLGERSVYEFTFRYAPGVSMNKSLNDDKISANAPTVRMSNLPNAFAKKIEERLAAFKKMPFFDPAIIGGGRSGGPPPPTN